MNGDELVYTFPSNTVTHTETVGRWRFGLVIALAVAFICLWGTLIGSMLPLIFHQIGRRPSSCVQPVCRYVRGRDGHCRLLPDCDLVAVLTQLVL